MAVINIRGTNGSGKTTTMMRIKEHYGNLVEEKIGRVTVYRSEKTIILGAYKTATGGCDTIKTQDEVCNLVLEFAKTHNVLFEGIVISTLHSRYSTLAHIVFEKHSSRLSFGYMNTDIDQCLANVSKRRLAKGKDPDAYNKDMVRDKLMTINRTRLKMDLDGHHTFTIRYGDFAHLDVLKQLD